MMWTHPRTTAFWLVFAAASWFAVDVAAAEPRLNELEMIGSHNSYHVAPDPTVLELIAAAGRGLPSRSITPTSPCLSNSAKGFARSSSMFSPIPGEDYSRPLCPKNVARPG